MWSIAFYIAENFVHQLREMDFVSKLFQVIAVSCVFDIVMKQIKNVLLGHFYRLIAALTNLNVLF